MSEKWLSITGINCLKLDKKILFVTTANLSTNPRLLKELLLAKSHGFTPFFLGFRLGNWSDDLDDFIIQRNGLENVHYIPATRSPILPWVISTGIEMLSKKAYSYFKKNLFINGIASNKRSFLLLKFLKKNIIKPDLVVGHNLGALFPVFQFAREEKLPFAFDLEDFHPGEKVEFDQANEENRRKFILQTILPSCSYFSFASPLIGAAATDLLLEKQVPKNFLINNCFSADEFLPPASESSGKVSFVWFSQNISAGRGLELVLPVLYQFRDQLRVVLIGQLNKNFNKDFLKQYEEIIEIKDPMEQRKLHEELASHDVGLAIDLSSSDLNRQLALTNKIVSYLQAGLFIFATDTSAQAQFLSEWEYHGVVSAQNSHEVKAKIEYILQNKGTLKNKSKERFEHAKSLAWEEEQLKLLRVWKKLLK